MNHPNDLARDDYELGATTWQQETEQRPLAIKKHERWQIRLG